MQVSIYNVLLVISSFFISYAGFAIEEEKSQEVQLLGSDISEKKIQPESREFINLSFAATVKKVAPAVVNIYASK
ncbi:MAG: hypothetical protein ACTHJ4_01155, partial [Candidatus Nucleicultricaceae bacterium]